MGYPQAFIRKRTKRNNMNFYLRAFLIFFRIGLFTIGGGYAMVPLIEADLVDKRKWVKKEDFLDLMALAQTVPGIFAVNIAIFIGYKLKGFWGAFWMALGTILPSFLIILTIALFFRQFQHVEAVEHVFKGIRPAVVALIAAPTFKMAKSARINRYNIWIPVVSALLIWLLGFSPIYVIILSGLGGYLYGRYQKKYN
jgi:chromate transporter